MGVMIPDPVIASNLSSGAKLTYGVLCRFAGRNGVCFPSQRKIGDRLGATDRQVRNYIAELVKHGYIERERHNRRRPNSYYFLWRAEFAAFKLVRVNPSPHERNDPSGKENHMQENHINPDSDGLPTHRKNRDAQAESVCCGPTDGSKTLPDLVQGLLGRRPNQSSLGRIASAAPSKTEAEAVEAIDDAVRRGYGEGKKGPRSLSWFVSVVLNYWADRQRRALPAVATNAHVDLPDFSQLPF